MTGPINDLQQGTLTDTKGENAQTVALSETSFLRKFVRHLTGTLEEVVGLHEATGYMATVAQRIGEQLNEAYRQSLGLERLNRKQVCRVINDIEKRINGKAEVAHDDEDKIVLKGCACPYGQDVNDRLSLCIMTTNLFGVIAAENLGYAKVSIEESQAQGDGRCAVVIHVKNTPACRAAHGREYFQS